MKDWRIKVVVVKKAQFPKTWKNSKGTGKVYSFELVDFDNGGREEYEEGELIQCSAFNDHATKYHKFIKLDTVYFISNGNVKPMSFKNPRIKHPFNITLEEHSKVTYENGESVDTY